jgi:transposase
MHYSVDFRKKVLEHLETSTIHRTAEVFKIARSAISAWKKLLKDTGSLKPAPLVRKPRKLDHEKLIEYVKAHPDAYLREIAAEFGVVIETVRKALIKLGYTQKKRPKYTGSGMKRGERSLTKKYQDIEKKI